MKKMEQPLRIAAFYIVVISLFLAGTLLGNKAVSVFAQTVPNERMHCIVIDAGHGGEDGGAISCTGKNESNLNLEIALRLDDLFHFLGYSTRMIRKTDTAIYTKGETLASKKVSDLKERVRIVNSTENAFLISIHQNHFPDERYYGAQVFYAKTAGSEEFAKLLQGQFQSILNPGSIRQAKPVSGVYLMEKINAPGVLVECGFLSNREEESLLSQKTYQQKICGILASVFTQYRATA